MRCRRCQTQNREGRRFCARCGAALDRACPACGFHNEADEAFCGGCGQALDPAPPPPAVPAPVTPPAAVADVAERRQLTVMFCDLAESTALSNRLDPEELSDVLRSYQRCCAAMVGRFGGLVAKYMGDGILIYFGYPQAHEDDAERAVLAALAIAKAVPQLHPPADSALRVRIGIATGLVVVGESIGQGAAQEQVVVGQTPNLAARLQSLAEPDAIVICARTQRLIGALFEFRDLGLLSLKGFDEPVQAWRVQGETRALSRFEALRVTTTPLVGRDEEVELLLRRWERAKAGEGAAVLVSGEPGIGKSRLAQSLFERLGDEPHTRLRYFASPHHQDSAFWPVITQLEHAAGFRREDGAEQKLAKLEALLTLATTELDDAVPIVANLLSVPTGDRYPALDLTPQKHREKAFRTILAQVEGLAARRPLLILYEDIHWSDPATRELLDLLVERVAHLPALLILTFRPEFAPPWLGRPQVTLLSLNRLAARHCAEMLTSVAGGKLLPADIAAQITDRTDGVPLFIEEFTKAVVESGLLEESEGRYSVIGPVPPMAIPTSLQASLLARLDRLASTREVVQIAAAFGRNFSHTLVAAATAIPEQALNHALTQLVQSGLIHRRGIPPDAEYTFKHALLRDAAYSTLLRGQRQQLHARIVATLEDQFPEIAASQPDLLARHCAEAGLLDKAVANRLRAGRLALARSAMTDAVAQLRQGLEGLAGLPDTPSRQQWELAFQVELGRALPITKGYAAAEVGDTFTRARALAEQLGRSNELLRLSVGQCSYHLLRCELFHALELAEQIERIGVEQGDLPVRLRGMRIRGFVRLCLGEFVTARTVLEQCHGLTDQADRTSVGGNPTHFYPSLLANLAGALAYLGYLDQARRRIDEALSEARRLGQPQALVEVFLYVVWIDELTSSAELEAHTEELFAVSTEHGFPLHLGWATVFRGWTCTSRGQAPAGLRLITQGYETIRGTGTVMNTPHALTWLAEAYASLGQLAEAMTCFAEALRIVEATDQRYREAGLYRARGRLLSAAGDDAAAERDYRQAIDIAKNQSARLVELQASISLARLWCDQGKRTQARELLAPIYGWFTEGFDLPDLKAAKALLQLVGAPASTGV